MMRKVGGDINQRLINHALASNLVMQYRNESFDFYDNDIYCVLNFRYPKYRLQSKNSDIFDIDRELKSFQFPYNVLKFYEML